MSPASVSMDADSGTISTVERRRYDIKRSVDGLIWETVFTAPNEDVSWNTAFADMRKSMR